MMQQNMNSIVIGSKVPIVQSKKGLGTGFPALKTVGQNKTANYDFTFSKKDQQKSQLMIKNHATRNDA